MKIYEDTSIFLSPGDFMKPKGTPRSKYGPRKPGKFNYFFFGMNFHPGLFHLFTGLEGQTMVTMDILLQVIVINITRNIGSWSHRDQERPSGTCIFWGSWYIFKKVKFQNRAIKMWYILNAFISQRNAILKRTHNMLSLCYLGYLCDCMECLIWR